MLFDSLVDPQALPDGNIGGMASFRQHQSLPTFERHDAHVFIRRADGLAEVISSSRLHRDACKRIVCWMLIFAAFGLLADISSLPPCRGGHGQLVSDEHVARNIAVAILMPRQSRKERSRFIVNVMQDSEGNWIAFQSEKRPIARQSNDLVIRAGGGFKMTINRCDAAVTGLQVQR